MFTRSVVPLVALSLLTGCPPEVSDKVGGGALLSTTEEPPGENCVNGGTMVQSGMDSNGDGSLADDEITSTSYICNGENGQDGATGSDGQNGSDGNNGADGSDGNDGNDGSSAIIKLTTLAPGAECAAGGMQVDAGVDDNGDGVLQPSEVDSTTYVCNGEDGAQGSQGDPGQSSGDAALVSVADEPSGANCKNGGVAIATGVDSNGNGTLDSSEVDQTVYVCDGDAAPTPGTVIEGSYTIENSFDVAQLAGVQQITGTLTITGNGYSSVSLPDLLEVGSLSVEASDLQTIDMSALTTIDDGLSFSQVGNTTYSFNAPALTTVGGKLYIYGDVGGWTDLSVFSNLTTLGGLILSNTNLSSLDGLSAITALPDGVGLSHNPSLTDIGGISNVTTMGDMSLWDFQGTDVDLPNLVTADVIYLYNSPLVSLELPSLTTGGLWIDYCGSLETMDISALQTASQIRLNQPYSLTELKAPKLTESGEIYVAYGSTLATIDLPQLTMLTGDLYIDSTLITDLSLPVLVTADSIWVVNSSTLATMDLGNLTTAGSISLQATALQTIDLSSLTTADALTIYYNTSLTDLDVSSLTTATTVSVQYNYSLATMDFSSLATVSAIYLSGTNYITSTDFPALTTANDIHFYGTSLTDINGFAKLKTLSYLELNYNYDLISMSGFDQVPSLPYFYVYYNPYMTTIGGFSSLTQLDTLYMDSNYLLDDISGLLNVTAGTNATFYYNPALCESTINTYASNTGASVYSYYNNSGC